MVVVRVVDFHDVTYFEFGSGDEVKVEFLPSSFFVFLVQ